MSDTDRIEKYVVLRAPIERVWRAISEAQQFGAWFGMAFDGEFAPHTRLTGRIAPTQVDPEVAKLQQPYVGLPFELHIEQIEPMRLFSFHWHPYAIERDIDYSREPMTRVEFALEALGAHTRLTITESGFDGIPIERRARAFAANEGGWAHQLALIGKYLQNGPEQP